MSTGPTPVPSIPGKRAFDLAVGGLLLVIASPVIAASALVIRLTSRGPAFYRATRVGRGGEPFLMYKLRSMYVTPTAGSPTTGYNDPRVTGVGRFLRAHKLDELPQLLNVVRGEMSLVGPRPEVLECVVLYDEEEALALEVRPGLTDLASLEFVDLGAVVGDSLNPHDVYLDQVFRRKNQLRVEYVRRQSWTLDLSILFRTLASIVSSKGPSDAVPRS